MQKSTNLGILLLSLSFLGILVLGLTLTSTMALFYSGIGFLVFSLPGIALGPAFFGHTGTRHPEWLLFGSILGIGLSGSAALAVGYLSHWSPYRILLAIAILTVLCTGAGILLRHRPFLPLPRAWDFGDYLMLSGIIVALTAFMAIPLANVGRLTSNGYAYTWLFGYDFLVRGEYTLSLTMGFPPPALPLAGEPLRMYLVGYAMPAFVYSLCGKTAALHHILVLTTIGVDVLFYGSIFCLLRIFSRRKQALLSTIAISLFCYSYYWMVPISKYFLRSTVASSGFHQISENLLQFGNVSHLFTPLLLVEPQAALGSCFLLIILFASELTEYKIDNYHLSLLYGLTLGLMFGTDALLGMTAILWFGLTYLTILISYRSQFGQPIFMLAAATVATAICAGSFFLIGMFRLSGGQEMSLSPYRWFLQFAPAYFVLEFGPLFLLGVWGFMVEVRNKRAKKLIGLGIFSLIAFLQVAFLKVSVLPRTRIGVRVFPIVFLIGVVYLFDGFYEKLPKKIFVYAAWACALLALPTYFTDVFFTSNVEDANETHYVALADRKACEWIKKTLPESAIVQGESDYLGYAHGFNKRQELYISLIADFAERRQVLGWRYIGSELVPHGDRVVEERSRDLGVMLASGKAQSILGVANRYGINYIYIGPYEKSLYPTLLPALESLPRHFKRVYSSDGVEIFRVDDPTA
jgi:hypothetical protein